MRRVTDQAFVPQLQPSPVAHCYPYSLAEWRSYWHYFWGRNGSPKKVPPYVFRALSALVLLHLTAHCAPLFSAFLSQQPIPVYIQGGTPFAVEVIAISLFSVSDWFLNTLTGYHEGGSHDERDQYEAYRDFSDGFGISRTSDIHGE